MWGMPFHSLYVVDDGVAIGIVFEPSLPPVGAMWPENEVSSIDSHCLILL